MEGDVHTTHDGANDGFALLSYPADFVGSSDIQIVGVEDDQVVDEGSIDVS
jgi:hypothetical protein